MLRSMYAAVSGLQSNQLMMDVVGNNIANVNTIGYKSSAAVFADVLSQTLNGAGLGQLGVSGGSNPAQVGLGVRLQAIETNFSQGATQLTGNSTDLAIQGDGMFVVDVAGTREYTRAGSFSLDSQGQLVDPDGGLVQGWQGVNGAVNTNASVGAIRIPVGQQIPASATTTVQMTGNLPADSSDGSGSTPATVIDASINVYNTLGTAVPLRVEYTKVPNQAGTVDWTVSTFDPDGNKIAGPTTLQFDQATGEIKTPASRTINLTAAQLGAIKVNGAAVAGAWNAGGINISFGTATAADRVTGSAGTNNIAAASQDGSPIGSLVSYSVSPEGLVSGVFSNGRNEQLAQIALANFTNPAGLQKVGGSMYISSVNSGTPLIGTAGTGGRGTVAGGAVEESNVDLGAEFTNLIVAQRGFQANARIITAADEVLQDLVDMKR